MTGKATWWYKMAEMSSETPSGRSVSSSELPADQQEVLATNPFSFEARTSHEALGELARFRSSRFDVKSKPLDDDIWKRPPPDFRLQVYAPKPPKRNSREAMKPWRYGSNSNQTNKQKKRNVSILPQLILAKNESQEKPFVTQFHVMDSFEARQESTKSNQHPAGRYQMPKHHDFRAYPSITSLGLPEFDTSNNRDPFNIKFHSERLDIMHKLQGDSPPTHRDTTGRQMAPVLHQPPKWESRLHLAQADKWPNRYHAYTRYRLPWRSPPEVLMDRVEDVVTSQWSHEAGTKMSSKNSTSKAAYHNQNATMLSVADS